MKAFTMWKTCLTAALAASCCQGAPLTWFPGPALNSPTSQAAAAVRSDKGNVLLGGDSWYPEELQATNAWWLYLPTFWGTRYAPGAAANGGLITIFGGSDGSNALDTTIGYDPAGDSPLTLASMSVPRSDFGYASNGGGLAYAIGGVDDFGNALSTAERYDADADRWNAVAPMPVARFHFSAVFDKAGHIFIFGGLTNAAAGTETASALRYSVSGNSWSAMAPMPIPTSGSCAALGADGKIYVVGGAVGGAPTNATQIYNPIANTWTLSTPLPEALTSACMGVDSLGRLLFIGGIDTNGLDSADVWRSQQLGAPDSIPTFTQLPASNADYNVPFSSAISASGNPQPTYVKVDGPAALNVDLYSGAITWLPGAADIGTNWVTLRATNYAGSIDWTFDIIVNPPPPSIPTNVTQIGADDDSVTLSWAPEDPLVGAVAYNVYEWHVVIQPKGSSHGYYSVISSGNTEPMAAIYGLAPGSSHIFAVAAYTATMTTGYSQPVGASTTAPQDPVNLTVTGLTSTTLSLAWQPSPGPSQNPFYSQIVSYTVSTVHPVGAGIPPNDIPVVSNIAGTTATVTGLGPGSNNVWTVQGIDAQGFASHGFDTVVVTNPEPAPVTVSNAAPTLSGGAFQFTVSGAANQTAVVEATTNLADPSSWTVIGSFIPGSGTFSVTDSNAGLHALRFYRITQP